MKADKRMQLVDLDLWQRNSVTWYVKKQVLWVDKVLSESDLRKRSIEISGSYGESSSLYCVMC